MSISIAFPSYLLSWTTSRPQTRHGHHRYGQIPSDLANIRSFSLPTHRPNANIRRLHQRAESFFPYPAHLLSACPLVRALHPSGLPEQSPLFFLYACSCILPNTPEYVFLGRVASCLCGERLPPVTRLVSLAVCVVCTRDFFGGYIPQGKQPWDAGQFFSSCWRCLGFFFCLPVWNGRIR